MGTDPVLSDPGVRILPQWVKWAVEVGGDPFNIERARRMAAELMEQHGVAGWELVIGSSREDAGGIQFRKVRGRWDGKPGTLRLSGPLMSLWAEDHQRDTILHEIAHALCPDDYHGPLWRYHAARIGANPTPYWGEAGEQRIDRDWIGTCPGGHTHQNHRRKPTKVWSCTQCNPDGFDERFIITWTRRT